MMVARRNWLLRCSILINVAVLLYICSHVMIGDNSMSLGSNYIYQDSIKLSEQQALQQIIGDNKPNLNRIINYNNADKNQIIDDMKKEKGQQLLPQQQQQQETQQPQQPKYVENSDQINLEKELPVNKDGVGGVDLNNNIDDKRFEVPTEQNYIQSKNDITYTDINLVNQSIGDGGIPTEGVIDLETRIKQLIKCHNKDFEPTIGQRGDFWVLRNYIKASHGELRCFETLTYSTHSDYTFLDNLIPLLERWNAPVSVAIHAPGTDFTPTINSIKYLRDCIPEGLLVRQFATFHIYFSSKHIPKNIPKHDQVLQTPYNCSIPPPFTNITSQQLYKTQKKLLYPVNVGRNVARDAAMTHFILASDIELYPNPGLVHKFLEMIARNDAPLQRKNPRVFPLSIFEVDHTVAVPRDKTELQELLRNGKAIPFHKRVCSSCHGVPKSKEWMAANETDDLGIFHIGKRIGYFVHWEPVYIGTHDDPHYDERLSWEGKSDKMTQGYALCALDYEFHILDNGFLVHKPGIKILKKDQKRAMLAAKTNQLIKKIIYPELQVMYGVRKGCAV